MLFFPRRFSCTLRGDLTLALAVHDAQSLRELCARHGSKAFATALATRSGRVIADALSLLAVTDRYAVFNQLPADVRLRCQRLGKLPLKPARVSGSLSIRTGPELPKRKSLAIGV